MPSPTSKQVMSDFAKKGETKPSSRYEVMITHNKDALSEVVTAKLNDGWMVTGNLIIFFDEKEKVWDYIQAVYK